MRKAFAYLQAIIFLLIIMVALSAWFHVALNQRSITKYDKLLVTARLNSASGLVYYDSQLPSLVDHQLLLSQLSTDALLSLSGTVYYIADGGFKLVSNRGRLYSVGFMGRLNNPSARYILVRIAGKVEKWID